MNSFYLFGWSGKLSVKERKQAAQELYKALCQLSDEYQSEHGVRPKLRIITHSHGGNVALNLANCATENPEFSLEELVLLACPVQEKTKKFIDHAIFKKIYALYSTKDLLQVADPQGIFQEEQKKDFFNRLWFSERTFPEHPKLKQAEVTYNGRGILHLEFLLTKKTEPFDDEGGLFNYAGLIEYLSLILQKLAMCPEQHQKIDLQD